jgi:transcriptional regulator with XRE-family HTH domain
MSKQVLLIRISEPWVALRLGKVGLFLSLIGVDFFCKCYFLDINCPKYLLQMEMLGDKIRRLRESRKLPLRKVAAFLDIDTSVLSKIERGERDLNKEMVLRISEFYELDKEEVLKSYLGETVAKAIYMEQNTIDILKDAEEKIKYLRVKSSKQGKIDY